MVIELATDPGPRRRGPRLTKDKDASGHPGRDVVLSVVVPIYNETDNISSFFERLEKVLDALSQSYEIICVDDGSTDTSAERLIAERGRNAAIKIVQLSRNFGKELALTAGLDHAQGAAVVVIDADQQDPPELIPELLAKWHEGYEVVCARRSSRDSDSVVKRVSASWFYRIYDRLADVKIPSDTGDFRLMDRQVVEALGHLPENNRFMKGLFAWVGFRQTVVEYRREGRAHGKTKWNIWQLWNLALEGVTSFSTVPLRVWSYIGFSIAILSFVYTLFLIFRTLFLGVDVPGYASLMAVVLFLGGMNLLTLGIIGEYLGRTYIEVKGRPLYLVRERHGFAPDEADSSDGG